MFPWAPSPETLRFSGNKINLIPSGPVIKGLLLLFHFQQGYPGFPGGYPGAMQQDPLYGYFAAVAGPVSNDIIKIIHGCF